MKKYPKALIVVSVVVVLSLGGLYAYLNIGKKKAVPTPSPAAQRQLPGITGTPKKGEVGYQAPSLKVQIGTKEVSKGLFNKVENGKIYFGEGTELTELPLASKEVVLACTTQDLSGGISELNFDNIVKIKRSNSSEIGGLIPTNHPIVVFAADEGGVFTAYRIAIDASSCPE